MRPVIRPLLMAAAAAGALLLAACGEDARKDRAALACPWPTHDAPPALAALADDLAAYQSALGHPPADLSQLDRSGLVTAGPHAGFAYAYHPAGIGMLRDGWRVVAVDDRRREQARFWCVLRPPVRVSGSPALVAALVSKAELREAAGAAGGFR
ncbi:MAG: hypothetical protein L6R48_24270 [Planctomycetes bacterium]|nr:hypothetical protein [Planctomycetota bacterium]